MERDVMLTGGSTAARGEGEEDEGNVLPLLSRISSHCLWTKKICRIWQCGLFKTARLPRSWQHVLRGRGIARICDRICREDRSLGKHPPLTRTDPHAHAREHKRALPLALSEYDEENLLVNDRTIPRPHLNDIRWTALKRCAFPTIPSWRGKFYRRRIHERTLPCPHFEGSTLDPHTRCLATSKADKEKIKNQRTNSSSSSFGWRSLDPNRAVWRKRLLVVVVSPTPSKGTHYLPN